MFKLRAGGSGVCIPVGKWVVSFSERPNILWGSICPLCNGYQRYFPEVKRPGRKLNHSTPSSAKVKNKWIYTPNLQLYISFLTRNILRITCKRIPSSMYNVGGTLNKYEYRVLVELFWQRKIEVPGKKPTQLPFWTPKIPLRMSWYWTRIPAVTGRRLNRLSHGKTTHTHA